MRAFGVEPQHPLGGRQLDLVDVTPGPLPANEFVLERPDGGLGQRVVQRGRMRSIPLMISELSR